MIMGIIIMKKRHDMSKYLSVLMITIGIVLCTIVSGSDVVSFNKSIIHKNKITNNFFLN